MSQMNSCLFMVLTHFYSTVRSFSTQNFGYTIPSGLVCVYKPKAWSSSDVVVRIRNILHAGAKKLYGMKRRFKIKVGHGGMKTSVS